MPNIASPTLPRSLEPAALLKIPDAARLLAIAPRSVWRLAARNEIDLIRLGRSVRVSRKSLDALLERGVA